MHWQILFPSTFLQRFRIFKVLFVGVESLFVICLPSYAQEVSCEVYVNGTKINVKVQASSSAFPLTSVDFDEGFRFSAQLISKPSQTSKLKTFVYQFAKSRYVLIHHAEWLVEPDFCAGKPISFGKHQVYSTKLEMPLQFQCESLCMKETKE